MQTLHAAQRLVKTGAQQWEPIKVLIRRRKARGLRRISLRRAAFFRSSFRRGQDKRFERDVRRVDGAVFAFNHQTPYSISPNKSSSSVSAPSSSVKSASRENKSARSDGVVSS